MATVTGTNGTSVQTGGQSTAKLGTQGDFDKFLYLLTQQLKNQDPLEPMDTAQFTNQLVQYSNVEQSININKNLQSLITMQQSSTTASLVNYIGKEVEAVGDKIALVDGSSKFKYALTDKADAISILIKDDKGNTVRTITDVSGAAGPHTVTWDGKDNSGKKVDDGTYTISVKATKNNNGTPQDLTVYTAMIGKVTAANTDPSAPGLMVGSVNFPIGNIITVRDVAAITTPTTPTSPPKTTTSTIPVSHKDEDLATNP